MPDPVLCPKCQRPNASHKVRCLYCGEPMPSPTAPPVPPAARHVPEDLDALVANALRTGRLRDLSVALSAPAPPASDEDTGDEATDPGQPVAIVPEPEPVPPAEALTELLAQVATLRAGARSAEGLALLAAAPDLVAALHLELAQEAQDQAAVPVLLPAFRLRWVLVVAPWDETRSLGALSQAAGLDQATLRLRGRNSYPQVLARSDDRADLDRRAQAITKLGLAATVQEQAALARIPAPQTLLRREDDGRWWATPSPLWQEGVPFDPAAPPPGLPLGSLVVRVVVPAEVVVQRYRPSSDGGRLGRKRESAARAVGEARIGVVDLHGPTGFVRLVEGITDLTGVPGAVPGSRRRSLQGVSEQLESLFPGAVLTGRRICQSAQGTPSISGGDALARTGWAQLEEHTRLVRLLLLGPA